MMFKFLFLVFMLQSSYLFRITQAVEQDLDSIIHAT